MLFKIYPKDIDNNVRYRAKLLIACESDLQLQKEVKELCKRDILFWINCFCYTKDPRRKPDVLPFITYPFQDRHISEIKSAIDGQYDYLNDKSRDQGVSWDILYVFMHYWIFENGSDFRVGSRKEDYVDKLSDIDTLLEKVRFNLRRQPLWMLPAGFDFDKHAGYMRIINPVNGNAIVGESANEHFGSGGRRKALLLDEFAKWDPAIAESAWTACYSKDFEVLTSEGWKLIKDVQVGEYVYSLNPKNRQAAFMPVLKKYEQYRDKLIEFSGKSVNLLVTENHEIVYETTKGTVCFKSAVDVFNQKSGSIPLVSKNSNQWRPKTIHDFDAGDWMELLGWYLSEGHTAKSGTIIITKTNKANPLEVKQIIGLLQRMGLIYSYNNKDFNIHSRKVNLSARKELKLLGKHNNKYIPKQYFKLHPDLLKRLFKSLLLGDGCDRVRKNRNTNATVYTTSSMELAGDVQILAQLIGYKASVRSRIPTNKFILGRPIKNGVLRRYDTYIGYKTKANINRLNKKYIDYNDKVYCVETEFHTLYVRRNGIACWCGNTGDVSKCRIVVSTPVGSANKFAQLACGTKEKIKKTSLHWTLHPEKSKGAYYLDGGQKIEIDTPEKAFALWQKGIKTRSPWYDAEAERRSESDLAQEVDIDYLRSGHPFFSQTALALQKEWQPHIRKLPSEIIPYGKYITGILVEIDHKIEFRETPDGWLRVFQLPDADWAYIISADTSEGLAKGDESFCVVRDRYTRNVVTVANGIYGTDDWAVKLQKVGKWYNDWVAVENNNHGHSVCQDLKRMDCKLYHTKNEDGVELKAGFTTTSKTRPQMLDQLEEEIRKNVVELRDTVLIAQCKTFVKNPKTGKPEADGDFLDDGVIACAIAGVLISTELPFKPKTDNQLHQQQRAAIDTKKHKPYMSFVGNINFV